MLTQSSSITESSGSTARLTWTLTSGFNIADYHLSWFQQMPGSPPRYLLRFKSDSDKLQASGVPSHFSGSKDVSANAGLLPISGLQPEDVAEYYCHSSHGGSFNSDTHRWGSGTTSWYPLCYSFSDDENKSGPRNSTRKKHAASRDSFEPQGKMTPQEWQVQYLEQNG